MNRDLLLHGKKNFFWDFDGVILDSMLIRDTGFREVLKGYPLGEVDKLMEFHNLVLLYFLNSLN